MKVEEMPGCCGLMVAKSFCYASLDAEIEYDELISSKNYKSLVCSSGTFLIVFPKPPNTYFFEEIDFCEELKQKILVDHDLMYSGDFFSNFAYEKEQGGAFELCVFRRKDWKQVIEEPEDEED